MLTVAENCRRDFLVFSAGLFGFLGRLFLTYSYTTPEWKGTHSTRQPLTSYLDTHSTLILSFIVSSSIPMAQVPTPPASRHSSEAPEVQQKETQEVDTSAALLQTLDTLLERYLHLLDRHQKLQEDLAKRLSSVRFLSLHYCTGGRHSNVKE